SYEDILAEAQADLIERFPDIEPVLQLESALVNKLMQVFVYREILLRARVNDAAKALMLATATGTDLDQFASDFGMERLIIGKNADGKPIYESDDDFRQRRNLAPDGYAAAGPENAYKYFALSADGRIKQVEAIKGENNRCDVVVLGRDGNGSVDQEIISKVYEALSAKTRRPLTDNVYVRSV
ncbi:baseplate J/gp47 family protein, partial [Bacillus anthracis]|uniref:baseplate assembly protein n=1 Tax=Bacillus anthracis TaxID=1392 RepID=UPI0039A46CCA